MALNDFFNNAVINDVTLNKDINAFMNKLNLFAIKYNRNLDLALSSFKIKNLPAELDERYIKLMLLNRGSIAITDSTNIGLCAIPYTSKLLNYKQYPVEITNAVNDIIAKNDTKIETIKFTNNAQTLKAKDFEIVYLTPSHHSLQADIADNALNYAMIWQMIKNNVIAKSVQYFLEGDENQSMAFDEIIDCMFNQNGFLKIDIAKGTRAEDFLKAVPNEVEWLGDRGIQLIKDIENDYLWRLGINHTPYEKKERLTNVEIQTNDEALDILHNGYIDTMNEGWDRVNKHYGTEIYAEYAIGNMAQPSETVEPIEQEPADKEENNEPT